MKNAIILPFIIFQTLSFSQHFDSQRASIDGLRAMLETASRAGQEVWVEDFTGLN